MSMPKSGHNFRETPFEEAIAVKPLNGSPGIYTANIARDWSGAYGAFGGYIAALICQAAHTHLALTRPKSKHAQPDPINSHFQFFSPNLPGLARVAVTLLKTGSSVSVVQVEVQRQAKVGYKTCTLGIINMSDISLEAGLTLPTTPSIKKEDIPDRERDCTEWTYENDPFMRKIAELSPANEKIITWEVNGTKAGLVADQFGFSVRRTWIARRDGLDFDIMSITMVCDWLQGAPGLYSPEHADLKAGLLYPTMSLTTEIKKVPKGARFLFMWARANSIKNGRYDWEVHLLDESGELVAMSKHTAMVFEGPLAGKRDEVRKLFKL